MQRWRIGCAAELPRDGGHQLPSSCSRRDVILFRSLGDEVGTRSSHSAVQPVWHCFHAPLRPVEGVAPRSGQTLRCWPRPGGAPEGGAGEGSGCPAGGAAVRAKSRRWRGRPGHPAVQQQAQPVVGEPAVAVADSLDLFHQHVQALGGAIGSTGGVNGPGSRLATCQACAPSGQPPRRRCRRRSRWPCPPRGCLPLPPRPWPWTKPPRTPGPGLPPRGAPRPTRVQMSTRARCVRPAWGAMASACSVQVLTSQSGLGASTRGLPSRSSHTARMARPLASHYSSYLRRPVQSRSPLHWEEPYFPADETQLVLGSKLLVHWSGLRSSECEYRAARR